MFVVTAELRIVDSLNWHYKFINRTTKLFVGTKEECQQFVTDKVKKDSLEWELKFEQPKVYRRTRKCSSRVA